VDTTLFDGTTLRLPRQLITGADGKNMERNPRQVDIPVSRPIGEATQGRDTQLDTAVRELLNQIGGK
jgi:tricorn protease